MQGRWQWFTRWRCFGSLLTLKKILAFVVVMTITLLTGFAIGGLFSMWCALKYNWSSSNTFGHWKHESESKTCTLFEMFAVYWIAFLISTSSLINIYKWWTSYSKSEVDSSQSNLDETLPLETSLGDVLSR
uniref:Uncharacterized protein n=1 Tax=Ditylenchus dipsaci TaxID=166011 RepID=A0A915ET57_9BILA